MIKYIHFYYDYLIINNFIFGSTDIILVQREVLMSILLIPLCGVYITKDDDYNWYIPISTSFQAPLLPSSSCRFFSSIISRSKSWKYMYLMVNTGLNNHLINIMDSWSITFKIIIFLYFLFKLSSSIHEVWFYYITCFQKLGIDKK